VLVHWAACHLGRAPRERRTARWASVPCRYSLNRWARPLQTTVAQDCPAAETVPRRPVVHRRSPPAIVIHRIADDRPIRFLIRNLTA
jgi:hypothetical protein